MSSAKIIIAGAGWAGLAAAVELSRQHIPVTLIESARQIGGRARSVTLDGQTLDNGQHLMIGAYRQLLELLSITGVDESSIFHRLPHQIDMKDINTGHSLFQLSLPQLPAPLHLLVGMLGTPSLSLKQKFITLLRFNRLLNKSMEQDMSVDYWLASAGLPEAYVEHLLKPLCLAALTTTTDRASAKAFQSVLQQTFNGPAANTDLLIPKTGLSQVFPQAARAYIESRGGEVLTGHKLEELKLDHERVHSMTINQQQHNCDWLILATPPQVTEKLLNNSSSGSAIEQQLKQLDYEPITTIYLQYPESVRLDRPMIGLLNATAEWLFDRRYCHQPGLMAAVISANGPHMTMDNTHLAETISHELARLFPHWPKAEANWVIREKRACFSCHPDVDKNRPGIKTAIENLSLCGDYVNIEPTSQAGLPSTLEAALRSGVECARRLIQQLA
ncbi:MAG: hydroxysqualene dehydroxylase HpnE [Gammaproteobacteria bacterium]